MGMNGQTSANNWIQRSRIKEQRNNVNKDF
jgi:hypothetical protein